MTQQEQRTWLITGADKGLGLSMARTALEQGDRVAVTVLAADGQHPLAANYPDRFLAFHLDARSQEGIAEVIAQVERAFGGIDVLVNNAGYGVMSVAEETPPDRYRPMFEVNFFSLTEMCRAVLPGMRKRRKGHIINLSSVAGFAGSDGFAYYSAAKFAVEGYSEALAKEVGPLGIRVTIIEPGAFRSDFAGPSLASELCAIEDYRATIGKRIQGYVTERHGNQPNDPARFGPAIWRISTEAEPPIRLQLGADCAAIVRRKVAQVLADQDRWQEVTRSTAFEPERA